MTPLSIGPNPVLLVITGPFACGKSRIVTKIEEDLGFKRAITATTRSPRPGEIHGIHYLFHTFESFDQMDANEELLEFNKVNNHLYGTPRSSIEGPILRNESVVVSVDPTGALSLGNHRNEAIRRAVVAIYLEVDLETCIRRARNRPGGMTDGELARRIETRETEEGLKTSFRRVPNPDGEFENAVEAIKRIVEIHRLHKT